VTKFYEGFERKDLDWDLFERINIAQPKSTSCFVNNILLNTFAFMKKIPEMETAYKNMVNRGIRPNSATFAMLVKGYSLAHEWDKLNNIYAVMRERESPIGANTFVYLVAQGSDVRYIHFAMDVFKNYFNSDTSTLFPGVVNLFHSCLVHDQLDYAEELWLLMFRTRVFPLPKTCDAYVTKLRHVLEQSSNTEVNEDWLAAIKQRLVNAETAQFKAWKYVRINKPRVGEPQEEETEE